MRVSIACTVLDGDIIAIIFFFYKHDQYESSPHTGNLEVRSRYDYAHKGCTPGRR